MLLRDCIKYGHGLREVTHVFLKNRSDPRHLVGDELYKWAERWTVGGAEADAAEEAFSSWRPGTAPTCQSKQRRPELRLTLSFNII